LKLIYATIAKPSSETTQNREKEFSHYSSRKEGIEKHDKEACWNISIVVQPNLCRGVLPVRKRECLRILGKALCNIYYLSKKLSYLSWKNLETNV
jgi:hypothetical protein